MVVKLSPASRPRVMRATRVFRLLCKGLHRTRLLFAFKARLSSASTSKSLNLRRTLPLRLWSTSSNPPTLPSAISEAKAIRRRRAQAEMPPKARLTRLLRCSVTCRSVTLSLMSCQSSQLRRPQQSWNKEASASKPSVGTTLRSCEEIKVRGARCRWSKAAVPVVKKSKYNFERAVMWMRIIGRYIWAANATW